MGAGRLLDHPPICAALVTAPRRLIMHQITRSEKGVPQFNECMFGEVTAAITGLDVFGPAAAVTEQLSLKNC